MSIKDGGPAFPLGDQRNQSGDIVSYAEFGMTLRDYFAAKAIASVMKRFGRYYDPITVARDCYTLADAMLRVSEA